MWDVGDNYISPILNENRIFSQIPIQTEDREVNNTLYKCS